MELGEQKDAAAAAGVSQMNKKQDVLSHFQICTGRKYFIVFKS